MIDSDLFTTLCKQDSSFIEAIKDELVITELIKITPLWVLNLNNPSDELYKIAFTHASKIDCQWILYELHHCHVALTKKISLMAMIINPTIIDFWSKPDKQLQLIAILHDPTLIYTMNCPSQTALRLAAKSSLVFQDKYRHSGTGAYRFDAMQKYNSVPCCV